MQILGERLYPFIHGLQPELAGKITGMLLEMDNTALVSLLQSPDVLMDKVQEAAVMLQGYLEADKEAGVKLHVCSWHNTNNGVIEYMSWVCVIFTLHFSPVS